MANLIEANDAYIVDCTKYKAKFKTEYAYYYKTWIIDTHTKNDMYYSILHIVDNEYKAFERPYKDFMELIQDGILVKEPELKKGDEFTVDYRAYIKCHGNSTLVGCGKPKTVKVIALVGGYIKFDNLKLTTKSLYKEIDLGVYSKINTQKQVVTSGIYCDGNCGVPPQVRYYGVNKSFNFCPKCRKEIV